MVMLILGKRPIWQQLWSFRGQISVSSSDSCQIRAIPTDKLDPAACLFMLVGQLDSQVGNKRNMRRQRHYRFRDQNNSYSTRREKREKILRKSPQYSILS